MYRIKMLNTIFNEKDNSFDDEEIVLPISFNTIEEIFEFVGKSNLKRLDFFLDSDNNFVITTLTKILKGE